MKKKIPYFVISAIIIMIVSSIFIYKNLSKNTINAISYNILDDLININELDDRFMNEFYDNTKKLMSSDNRDNVLIVVSTKNIKNTYGAKNVVKAPNNIYLLEYECEMDRDLAKKKFESNTDIYSVVENRQYTLYEDPSSENKDSSKKYNSWGIEKAGLDHAINIVNEKGGEDVTAAIIDSGCDLDLFNNFYNGKIQESYNLYEPDIYGYDTSFDHVGHGTHVAGTIAEGTPDNVKILPIKVSDSSSLDDISIIYAITYITDNHKADVINMSFGKPISENVDSLKSDPEYIVIEAASRENIISVAATGNSNDSIKELPAAFDNTLSISAVDSNLNKAEFSSYGDTVSFAAPGVDILSINGVKSGTSMATPHAVSSVAILKSFNKNISFETTIELLKENSVDIGAKGKDNFFGYGFIDLSSFIPCDENVTESCTSIENYKEFEIKGIEVEEVAMTSYNYGSLTNILPTKIKLLGDDNTYKIKTLDKIDDITITGYDPYLSGEQTINIKYMDFETSFIVSNPQNYETGWIYTLDYENENSAIIGGYKDNNLQLEKLYFPSVIDGYNIHTIRSIEYGYNIFSNSNDAIFYKEVYLPDTIKEIGYKYFKNLKNLYKFKSDADELKVGSDAFSELPFLTIVDANILFSEYSSSVFYKDISLEEVRLSSNNKFIPSLSFTNCYSLTDIILPENLKKIDYHAFYNSGLKNLVIPNKVEEIKPNAFYGIKTSEIYIPASITNIDERAFGGKFLSKISVDEGNTVYDSRDDCNAVIETETNTLIIGTKNSFIPNDIKKIGKYAFFESYVKSLTLPDGLESIEEYAFSSSALSKITIPKSVKTIANNSFNNSGNGSLLRTLFYTYSSSFAHEYALANNMAFVLIDKTPNVPEIENVWFTGKTDYLPFETADLDSYVAQIKYVGIDEIETITKFDKAVYQDGRDSLRYGDWSMYLYFDTSNGYHNLLNEVPVDVGKLTPEYEIPTDVYANVNSTLADVDLPSGFEWEDTSILVDEIGDKIYDARYTPEDTNNYKIVDEIAIPVHVVNKTLVKPTITVNDKTYDGTKNLNLDSITINGIANYTLESASIDNSNVGNRKALIKIKLSDEDFENYSFSNGKQEKTFEVDIKILPEKVDRPTAVETTYIYNHNYQFFKLDKYNNKKMNISGNKQINAGTYYVTVSLKNSNYVWSDGYTFDCYFEFVIGKANIEYYSNDTNVLYDGNEYGIDVWTNDSHTTIKYMDDHGNYTLDDSPKYSEPGVYIIKYMITYDNNYYVTYGQNTLIIKLDDIINNTADFECEFDGKEHSIDIDLDIENYVIKYSIDNENYDMDTIPKFKNPGEYIIYYKISADGYNDLFGSNKVKIYGINGFDSSIINKDDNLFVRENDFEILKEKISTYSNSTVFEHYNSNKEIATYNNLKTGDTVKIKINDSKIFEYKIAFSGDTNGDGKINYLDYVSVYNHIQKVKKPELDKKLLEDIYLLAADTSEDNKINYLDYVKIYNKIKELKGGTN